MNKRDAERIRFGVLSARRDAIPQRLTEDQWSFLDERYDWMVCDDEIFDAYCRQDDNLRSRDVN